MQGEDTVQRVLRLMRETFGKAFQEYYDGDPEAIPLFNLPAIIVTQTGDETSEDQQGEDKVLDAITIKVVFNKRDDFTGDKIDPLNLTERKIREIIARRDPETGAYDPQSVKGAIRKKLLDDFTAVAPTMNVEYGVNPRVAGEGLADLTAEGHVSFTVEYPVETY